MCPAEVSGWVFGHDASATTPKVLLRWDDVMASSALKSALRYTACRQAVYLKIRLRLWLAGRHRRSVGNLSVIRGRGRFGPAATNRSEPAIGRSTQAVGLSLQAGTPARPAKPREQKPCDGTFAGADRWPTGAGAWSRYHKP